MSKVVHHLKSGPPVFLFLFLELGKSTLRVKQFQCILKSKFSNSISGLVPRIGPIPLCLPGPTHQPPLSLHLVGSRMPVGPVCKPYHVTWVCLSAPIPLPIVCCALCSKRRHTVASLLAHRSSPMSWSPFKT
jgi:hypothetical protein